MQKGQGPFERWLRSQHVTCCSATPWSQGVSHAVTQLLPGMCLGCLPALQQDVGMQLCLLFPGEQMQGRGLSHAAWTTGDPGQRVGMGARDALQNPTGLILSLSAAYNKVLQRLRHTSGSKQVVSAPSVSTPPSTFPSLRKYSVWQVTDNIVRQRRFKHLQGFHYSD